MCVPIGELVGIRMYSCVHVYMLLRDAEGRKQGHTNNKAKQHSTPKAIIFPKEK